MRTSLLTIFAVSAVSIALSRPGEWKIYTAKHEIRAIAKDTRDPSVFWVAASGGMFAYRLSDKTFRQFTTSEGLRSNDITAIVADERGNVWIGAGNGYIHRYSPVRNEWQYITDIYLDEDHGPSKRINGFHISGDTLFILSDIGVSVFLTDRLEFRDSYLRFGSGTNQLAGNATGLQIFKGKIWISTRGGISSASITDLNLSSPESWEVFTTDRGLPSNTVRELAVYNDTLIAATPAGLAMFDGSAWSGVPGTTGLDVTGIEPVSAACSGCAPHFITSGNQIWKISDGLNIEQVDRLEVSLSVILSRDIVGTSSNGLFIHDGDEWHKIVPPGPPSNKFVGIAIDGKGALWSGTGRDNGEGFMSFDGERWRSYTSKEYPILKRDTLHKSDGDNYYRVSIGRGNSKWISSWGDGIALLDDRGEIVNVFNTANGLPPCIPNDLSYAVAGGVAVDRDGNTWITSRTPPGDTSLVFFRPDSTFGYITGCGYNCRMRNPYNVFTDVVIDRYGTKWFANFNRFEPETPVGFYYYNENYTLPRTTNGWGKLSSSDGLTSDKVWCLAVDREGAVWIGSDQGITIIFDPSNPAERMALYHPLRDQIVQSIAVDALDNKWVATKQGVFVLSPDGTSIVSRYTVQSTDGKLLNDDVTSIAIDHNDGTIYFGTEKGLSSLKTAAIEPQQSFTELRLSPNPYVLPDSPSPLSVQIDGLVRSSLIKITTINGTLVKTIPTDGGRIGYWDGRNERGELASTGVYLVIAFSEDGSQVASGKIAVIRK